MPLIGAAVAGPSNAYMAILLVLAGLVAAGTGCAFVAYGLARRVAPGPVALIVGLGAAVPVLLPMFGSVAAIDLRASVIYGIALATANALVDRSVPAFAFLGLWLLAGGLVGLAMIGGG
jgi:hypothetical protein